MSLRWLTSCVLLRLGGSVIELSCTDKDTVDNQSTERPLVVVADDEPVLHVLASRSLEGVGFEVLHAMHGLQVIELLSREAEPPCLVIADMRMPYMNGSALGAWVRSRYPSTPILYISGYEDELPPTGTDGSYQVLEKPFTPEMLLAKVRELCKDAEPIDQGFHQA